MDWFRRTAKISINQPLHGVYVRSTHKAISYRIDRSSPAALPGQTIPNKLSFFIGAPFSYWLMNIWLADFAYRITPSIWIFAFAGLSTLLVAILITSYHALKAAMTNPVEVLKDE